MSSSGPQHHLPIDDPSQEYEFFNPHTISGEASPFHGQQPHYPGTPQKPSFLTSYSPISPSGLSLPLSEMQLHSDSDPGMCGSQQTFTFLTPSYGFTVLTQTQSESVHGTASGSHASDLDRNRSRPTINIQTQLSPPQSTPYLSAGTTASSSASSYLPSPRTPNLNPGTCPTFTKSLPSDDYPYDFSDTIDPTLLQPTPEIERGRSLGPHPQRHRRSRSTAGPSPNEGRASQRSARPRHTRQQSREGSPLPLDLNAFGVESGEEMPASISIFFEDTSPLFPDITHWYHGDRSQSADEDVSAMPALIHQDQKVNGKRSCTSHAKERPGFKNVVASDEVVQASKIRRTTTGPRFKCPMEGCSADFTAKHNLKNHINAHNGVRKYVCPFCERKYTTSHVMNRHKKTCKQGKQGKRKATR